MTSSDFTAALTTLGLDNHQAAQWLGVSVKSVRRYRVSGAPGPVAGMVRERLERRKLATAAHDLAVAVRFNDPPKNFSGVLCHVARIPVEFVSAVEDSLALDWRE